jgi:oxalate decarboxylase
LNIPQCCGSAQLTDITEENELQSSRRSFFGTAALGAGGLVTLTRSAFADAGRPDAPKPGDGGFGRQVSLLPPGQTVVYHDPKDVGEMPEFTRSLDGSTPKVTSGGWAKESTEHQLPIMKGLAGVHMFMDPGGSRELHWHAMAAEWAYVIDGRCQTVVLDPSGQTEINNYGPGDLWFFPRGHGHAIQTIGNEPCHFILSFDNGAFSEHGTFSITDWVSLAPKDMLAKNFGLTKEDFAAFPQGETYIQAGPVLPVSEAIDTPWPKESTHKFSLMKDVRARRDFDGGTFNLATVDEWPISKTMSGGLMVIQPGQTKALHWHPNANEFQFYLKGNGQVSLFGSGGRGKVADVKAGDTAYIPAGYGHGILNTGDEDLEIIQTWDAGKFEEITLKHWMATAPKYLLSNNMVGVPHSTLDKLQQA